MDGTTYRLAKGNKRRQFLSTIRSIDCNQRKLLAKHRTFWGAKTKFPEKPLRHIPPLKNSVFF